MVTGGGTGIGKAITKELARLGCKVVIASRKLDRLEEAAAEINKEVVGVADRGHVAASSRVFSYECNIRNEDQVCNLISRWLIKYTAYLTNPNKAPKHVTYT